MNQDFSSNKGEKPLPSSVPSSVPAKPASIAEQTSNRLFRAIDWWAFALTTLLVMVGYMLTLAPDVTLEDSGELATGSFYAGVPHPPGYPVWTVYTWLFTKLLPFHTIAWRVSVGEALAGAIACGLIALVTSRGSSMMVESIAALKSIPKRFENAICIMSGFVAGMLMGFNGYMWSQSVIVEVYSLSVASLMLVIAYLLRWLYQPEKRRYLYWAFFFFGICLTNHMSLLVAAMGIEIAILAANPKVGRDFFFGNSVVYLIGLVMKITGSMPKLDSVPLFVIFNLIGIGSLYLFWWYSVKTPTVKKWLMVLVHFGVNFLVLAAMANSKDQSPQAIRPLATLLILINPILIWGAYAFSLLVGSAEKILSNWASVVISAVTFVVGVAFYLYMPIASMSNPPMNWGYPRTAEGFMHAVQRGQYESVHPVGVATLIQLKKTPPFVDLKPAVGFVAQIASHIVGGAMEEFSLVYLLIGLLPFVFFRFMQNRERAWIIGLAAIYLFLSMLLLILLNPGLDRQSLELHRVFFTASHAIIAIAIGYGLTLGAAYLVMEYATARFWALVGGGVAAAFSLYTLYEAFDGTLGFTGMSGPRLFFYGLKHIFTEGDPTLQIYSGLLIFVLALVFLLMLFVFRTRFHLTILLCVMAAMPLYSILGHWFDNEQRDHYFGYWFGHDMFSLDAPDIRGSDGKPIYPNMAADAVEFGGTDPGRFNPTYMIFCESFTKKTVGPKESPDPNFDRRDVALITQNALADGTYLNYIRAHYNRSAQIDPPFFQNFFHTRALAPLDNLFLAIGDHIEKMRRAGTSYFKPADFVDLKDFASKLRDHKDPVSKYVFDHLDRSTQQLLASSDEQKLRSQLASQLNQLLEQQLKNKATVDQDKARLAELQQNATGNAAEVTKLKDEIASLALYAPERFQDVKLSAHSKGYIKEDPRSHTVIRWSRLLLEDAYPNDIAKSIGGVYPDLEIHTPSAEESQRCFNEYLMDAQKRYQQGRLKPGEDFRAEDGRVQVSGQVAVMTINGLLTKVIFDANPDREFYVEESFPLEWMFPHLTPFGIIMKINRQPVKEITEDIVKKDHEFWSKYSQRLIGNWITYDTPITNICDWAEKVYLRHDFDGFKGDRKFVRDDNAQKAFSKLRSSIGGTYLWRLGSMGFECPPEFLVSPTKNKAEYDRVTRECEFAFKQAFAFCPFSPEAVYRFVQFLSNQGRHDEAIAVARTCVKLDPQNDQIRNLVTQIEAIRDRFKHAQTPAMMDAQTVFQQIDKFITNNQRDAAAQLLDQVIATIGNDPNAAPVVLEAARRLAQLGDSARLEKALEKMVQIVPDNPEAWYDLAGLRAMFNRPTALDALRKAIDLSDGRLKQDPKARDLKANAAQDPRFGSFRQNPEFQRLTGGK